MILDVSRSFNYTFLNSFEMISITRSLGWPAGHVQQLIWGLYILAGVLELGPSCGLVASCRTTECIGNKPATVEGKHVFSALS